MRVACVGRSDRFLPGQWPPVAPGAVADEDNLARLVALSDKSAEEVRRGMIGRLRPELENPAARVAWASPVLSVEVRVGMRVSCGTRAACAVGPECWKRGGKTSGRKAVAKEALAAAS